MTAGPLRDRLGRSRRRTSWRRRVGVRLLDQVAWSAAFFAFNLAATLVLPTADFALLAVTTSGVFIAIAVARAWAIGSRIVVATKFQLAVADAISGRSMIWTCCIVSAVVALGVWLGPGRSTSGVIVTQMIMLSIALIAADMPRQGLIFSSSYNSSLFVSLTYAVMGLVAFSLAVTIHIDPMWLWAGTGFVCAAVAWIFLRAVGVGRSDLPAQAVRSHAWRMTAESLYSSIASQLGLLLLYVFTTHDATAGYRLSYALVFAPAFMLLQGISPLLTVQMAGEIAQKGSAALKTWLVGPVLAILAAALCGLAGWAAAVVLPLPDAFDSVVPFLVPVGLALASAQVLEYFLVGIRYFASEHTMHRVRILIVSVDLIAQAGGVGLGGVDGLILALIVVACLKLVVGTVIAIAIVRGGPVRKVD